MRLPMVFFISLALTACGGGGGGNNTNPASGSGADAAPSLKAFSDTTSTTPSHLTGHALRTATATGATSQTSQAGQFNHATQAATMDGGAVTLSDIDGYEYVKVYTQSASQSGSGFDVNRGILGITAMASDIPSSGTAHYIGAADAVLVQLTPGAGSYDLTQGTANIAADFGAARVDVTLTDFTASELTFTGATVPIDTIHIDAMAISETGFSGGALRLENNGSEIDILGANGGLTASGSFYGAATGPAPDEIGGAFLGQGDDGTLSGTFVGAKQ